MFEFKIESTDGSARTGVFSTPHGDIKTPVFMPVGTQATVKGITKEQIMEIGSQIMLSNTYHLYLKPGDELIESFGGLHEFMGIDLPILTDSGGFQVFSLGNLRKSNLIPENTGETEHKGESLVKITEDGVYFRSHRDGSKHFFTPEKAMQIQEKLGADIIMAFDECAPGDSSHSYARKAMERTHRWAVRSLKEHNRLQIIRKELGKKPQTMFPIIQGVIYDDLRTESVKFLRDLNTDGIAIGGLSVGESKEDLIKMLDVLSPLLPPEKPHYLMGLGTPEDLVEGIYRGIDMFDCVLPTRLGRHGVAFSSIGNIKMTNEKYIYEKSGIPVDPELATHVSKTYSLGYLRHLLHTGELLGGQLLSLHNLEFLHNITKRAREAIEAGKYEEFRSRFWSNYNRK
ncbi:MAG: tRNA guanosine(34) transglycosylase Tgt [Candidatus Gracilibacteria bacterium]|nr:tRNA guanosine(34) transglycosylase Tgt [Candidatus Gracilibacteria bacterium]